MLRATQISSEDSNLVSREKTRPVCFVFERTMAPRHFLIGKGHPLRKSYNSIGAFQGRQGNDQGAWRQLPMLPPCSIRPRRRVAQPECPASMYTICGRSFCSTKKEIEFVCVFFFVSTSVKNAPWF